MANNPFLKFNTGGIATQPQPNDNPFLKFAQPQAGLNLGLPSIGGMKTTTPFFPPRKIYKPGEVLRAEALPGAIEKVVTGYEGLKLPSTFGEKAGKVALGAESIIQSINRNIASAGLTFARGEKIKQEDLGFIGRGLFGEETIKPIEQRVAETELTLRKWGEETAKTAVNSKEKSIADFIFRHPEVFAFAGVMGSVGIDLTPFGGLEKGAYRAMIKAKTIGEATSVLSKMGVADDLVRQFAPDVVKVADEKTAKVLFNNIANLQRATKIAPLAQKGALEAIIAEKDIIEGDRVIGKLTGGKEITGVFKVDKGEIFQSGARKYRSFSENPTIIGDDGVKYIFGDYAPDTILEMRKVEKGIIPQELEPLAQEARKYKSAEEFVSKVGKIEVGYDWKYLDEMKQSKAEGYAYSHSDFDALSKLEKANRGTGVSETFYRAGEIGKDGDVWLTPQKSGAEQYAKSGGTKVGEYKVATQNPLNLNDISDIEKIIGKIEGKNFVNNPDLKQKLIDYAKKNGYDSVSFPDSFPDGKGGMQSLIVFDKSKIYTKSQLTDFYTQATKGVKEVGPVSKMTTTEIETEMKSIAPKLEETYYAKAVEGLSESQQARMEELRTGLVNRIPEITGAEKGVEVKPIFGEAKAIQEAQRITFGDERYIKKPVVRKEPEIPITQQKQTGMYLPPKEYAETNLFKQIEGKVAKEIPIPKTISEFNSLLSEEQIKVFEKIPSNLQREIYLGSEILDTSKTPIDTLVDKIVSGATRVRVPTTIKADVRETIGAGNYMRIFRKDRFLPTLDELANDVGISDTELFEKISDLIQAKSTLSIARGETQYIPRVRRVKEKIARQNLIREGTRQKAQITPGKISVSLSDSIAQPLTSSQEARSAFSIIDSAKPVEQFVEKPVKIDFDTDALKDISGFKGAFRDVYRNFREVFGKKFEDIKRAVLDPFDDAKGLFVNEEIKLTNELNENIVKKFKIYKGSKDSAILQDFGEGLLSEEKLVKQVGRERTNNFIEADRWFRTKYDQLLGEINEVRMRIYPNQTEKLIPKRKDYYRHFQELSEGVDALKNVFETPAGITPSLAGISPFTKPKSKFLSFAQRRLGLQTDKDAVGGFLDYTRAFAYAKHIDPQIGTFRKLAQDLAKATDEKRNVNNFIEFLQDFSNNLAGKTNPADRYIQKIVPGGRKTFKVMDWLNRRVKMNVILGNLSSSVAQIFNVPQAIGSAKQHSIKGAVRTLTDIFVPNNAMAQSSFIKERYARRIYDKFERGMFANTKKFAAWVTGVLDEVGTKFAWNAHYEKALKEGIPNPIRYADAKARDMVAGRGIGEVPLGQQSRLFQVVAPFQLEVGNAWWVMKDFVSEKNFSGLATFFVASYLMNRAVEQIRGNDVSFDPINAVVEGIRIFQDEEDKKKGALLGAGRVAGEVFSNIPLGQTIAGMLPEEGVGLLPSRRELFGAGDPTRFGGGLLLTRGITDPLYQLITPFGGIQIKKTKKGIEATLKGQVETATGKLKKEIEPTPLNTLKGVLFGPSAFSEIINSKDRVESLFRELKGQERDRQQTTERAEQIYNDLNEMPKEKARDTFNELIKENPFLAQKVSDIGDAEDRGLELEDRLLLQLGVENGERAKFIFNEINKLKSKEEKKNYYQSLIDKKVITKQVNVQILEFLGGK